MATLQAAPKPASEASTGVVLFLLAADHAHRAGMAVLYADSTVGALPFYTERLGMDALPPAPSNRFKPVRLALGGFHPAAVFGHAFRRRQARRAAEELSLIHI